MTLLDMPVGAIVELYSGEHVEVEVVNACRVRIRPLRWSDHTFTDAAGIAHHIRARAQARDVAPSVPVARVLATLGAEDDDE